MYSGKANLKADFNPCMRKCCEDTVRVYVCKSNDVSKVCSLIMRVMADGSGRKQQTQREVYGGLSKRQGWETSQEVCQRSGVGLLCYRLDLAAGCLHPGDHSWTLAESPEKPRSFLHDTGHLRVNCLGVWLNW